MITRDQLAHISENLLREEILIPLFTAMGYRDVFGYHGGALEVGKDIVMWKPDDFRDRVNYAVVVKKGNLTGRASGGGSAGEVEAQIRQSFGSSFKDHVTGEDRKIHRCLVVVSGKIPKEFLNAISGSLAQNGYDRDTEFWDGDKTWTSIEKFLPQKTLSDRLNELQTFLSDQLAGQDLEIRLSKKEIAISVKPDEGFIKDSPLPAITISAEGEHALEAQRKYEAFIKTGEPFLLTKSEIKNLHLPDFVTKVLGISESELHSITIGPLKSVPVKCTLKRCCDDGDVGALTYVELEAVKAGLEQVTLTNKHQKAPWLLDVIMEREKLRLSYRTKLGGANVKSVLEWLQFQRASAKPGQFVLQQIETGIEYPMKHDEGHGEPPPAYLIELAEKLTLIQTRTRTLLNFPVSINTDEAQSIEDLFTIVKTGRLPLNQVSFALKKGALRKTRQMFDKPGALNIQASRNQGRTCLGHQFELGPARVVCAAAVLTEECANSFWGELNVGRDDDDIHLTFAPAGDEPMEVIYTNWLMDLK